mgnify:CR=1 FL=1|jgi:hypothetical protein
MAERMGANGLPIQKKKVETIDEIKKDESKQMIQEILEENPNENILDDFEEEEEDNEEL